MPTVTGNDGTETFYKDWGSGQPIVFSHGWPLSSDDWDNQMLFFVSKGYRVVAHDRRGHGRSAQVTGGHDMDHYADDLAAVTAHLDLRDAIHVGHSTADLLRFFRPWTRQRARARRYRGVCSSHVSVVSATSRQRPSTGIEWPRPGNSR